MAMRGYVGTVNPLNVKLSARSFVQLTIWIMVIFAAIALARWGYGFITGAVGRATGAQTQTGSPSLFFG